MRAPVVVRVSSRATMARVGDEFNAGIVWRVGELSNLLDMKKAAEAAFSSSWSHLTMGVSSDQEPPLFAFCSRSDVCSQCPTVSLQPRCFSFLITPLFGARTLYGFYRVVKSFGYEKGCPVAAFSFLPNQTVTLCVPDSSAGLVSLFFKGLEHESCSHSKFYVLGDHFPLSAYFTYFGAGECFLSFCHDHLLYLFSSFRSDRTVPCRNNEGL